MKIAIPRPTQEGETRVALIPESVVKQLEARIRELERALGKKTMQVEILEEAVKIAREKKLISGASSSGKRGGR